jgi:signal transduction histidine kinase
MVIDRGQGFPPESASELFRPFTVADVTHHSQGTGLNLALAYAIVEAYGGKLWAESEGVGLGATFTAAFPSVSLAPANDTECDLEFSV